MAGRCASRSVTEVLVGLHRIGIVGLREAFAEADASGEEDREALLERLMAALGRSNYVPPSLAAAYRQAVWREYQRHRGADIRDLYSELEVVVRGEPGEARDRFVATVAAAFGDYELKPVVAFEPPDPEGPDPQLLIAGEAVVGGAAGRREVGRAVGRRISDW